MIGTLPIIDPEFRSFFHSRWLNFNENAGRTKSCRDDSPIEANRTLPNRLVLGLRFKAATLAVAHEPFDKGYPLTQKPNKIAFTNSKHRGKEIPSWSG